MAIPDFWRANECQLWVLDEMVDCFEDGRSTNGFDYQIECYLPAARREFGYFCLPLLYRDRCVGRIDCKAHRNSGLLEIKSRHIEKRIDAEFDAAFAEALRAFAQFNGCDRLGGAAVG